MNIIQKGALAGLILSSVPMNCFSAEISETPFSITAAATAPLPTEVKDETQARALSREAAVALAQAAILERVLQMKTRSHKLVKDAEIPSLELQNNVRATIQGAEILKTKWTADSCRVTLVLRKSRLRPLLRNY